MSLMHRQLLERFCHLPHCTTTNLGSNTPCSPFLYTFGPCFQYLLAFLLHCFFLSLAVLQRKVDLPKPNHFPNAGASSLYRATSLSCIALFVAYVIVVIWGAIYGVMKGWSRVAFVESAGIVQVVAWCTMFILTTNFRKGERREKFPSLLRAWWLLSFSLSVLNVVWNILLLRRDVRLPVDAWVNMAAFPICTFLSIVAISGRTGLWVFSEDKQEPLLNGSATKIPASENMTPYAKAGFFSLAIFSWMNPLLSIGYKKPIQLEDIPQLVLKDQAEGAYEVLKMNWDRMKAENPSSNPSMFKCLVRSFWKAAAASAVFAGLDTCASYVGPYMIDNFVEYLAGEKRHFSYEGYALVLVFFVAKLVESLSQRHWFFGIQVWGLRVRAALTAIIYRKGLYLSNSSRQKHTSGEIINYMSVDVQRIGDFSWYLHDIWQLPLQVCLALLILHKNLGLAAFSALGATAVTMLANLPLARIQEKFQSRIMLAKDARMKATSEVLKNMKILKLQAWEIKYLKKLEDLRKTEYGWLRKFLYALSAITSLFWAAPTVVAVATFGTCVLIGIPLTAGRVLTALATFRILQQPIYNLPDLVSMIVQTKVSVERIGNFLQEQELQSDAIDYTSNYLGDHAIQIEGGSFSWDEPSENPTLTGLNLEVKHGMRVAVCGIVGCGKSSLLSCILGEMPRLSGSVKVHGSRAYVPQSAWIQSGKIEDSILFGSSMDRTKYDNVLEVCALKKDLELFSHGDQTEIGERGINLSGGQKQRIQLARAIYQDADIYLLDDPFSAVDAHTGTKLFQECILGVLQNKTIVYVTHQVEFLPAADLIVVLKDGKIVQAGKYDELLQAGTDFKQLVDAHQKALESIEDVDTSGDLMQETADKNGNTKSERTKIQMNRDDCQSFKRNNSKMEEIAEQKALAQIVQEEERETGKVSMAVYCSFITAAYGGSLVPVILLAQIIFQLLQIGSNYWMALNTPATSSEESSISSYHLLLVYIFLAAASLFCILIRAVLVSTVALVTAQKFFMSMLQCIFRAPMSFFDATPAGRILNRASTDQSALDMEIPNRLAGLAFSIIQLLGIIVVMCQVAWEVLILVVPVAAICIWLQRYYVSSARELSRLVGIRKSPIIHHFGESIAGVATIRGFNQEARFMEANLHLIDNYSRPLFHNSAAMEWLCFRLDMLTSLVFTFSLILVVTLPFGTIDPGNAGLGVTYGLNLNMIQAWVMWNLCYVENKIISLERIQQYTRIPSEAPLVIEDFRPPLNWPFQGTIELKDLQVRYGAQMPLVLHGITCTFYGGKKVGVVGRTGSGKSTLIQTLFRIVEPAGGQILIDGLDISLIGLHDLRSRLSIIPQDPTMFEGTLRGNLDPLEEHTDAELWEALDKSQLGPPLRIKGQDLNALVTENGENWSVGQRQLVCLARALLKHTKILVLDEATASVDTATDGVIQSTLRTAFTDCTVITIAHRIATVIDNDWVLVLSDGRVAEYNSPTKLLEDRSSMFSQLVSEYSKRSSSVSDLRSMAQI